jgi:GNAT superfamily N-acetyltransferase
LNPGIVIKPFEPENQQAVKGLILAGLAEHWGTLDLTRNPDLDDIGTSYARGVFLVAWLGERVVGAGALVLHAGNVGEIVRMSVAAGLRRRGVGRLILNKLVEHANARGLHRLILETTVAWQDAVAFYQRCGFRITHYQDGDVYFTLDLED